MELEEFKTVWQQQKVVTYSPEELNSIFHIKQSHNFAALKLGFSWDLRAAILISVIFIIVLQVLNLRTSDFWSACMAILAIQHVLFYQLQAYLLRKYSVFTRDVSKSITVAISKIRVLLWFYRLWPALLTIILQVIYIFLFTHNYPIWQILLVGTFLATAIAILSNMISAVLVRKQLIRLLNLKQELTALQKN